MHFIKQIKKKLFQSFGGAACQSSSFGWPLVLSEDNIGSGGFYFVNTTLNSHLEDRLPQRILIDVGGLEEDSIYQARLLIKNNYFIFEGQQVKQKRFLVKYCYICTNGIFQKIKLLTTLLTNNQNIN